MRVSKIGCDKKKKEYFFKIMDDEMSSTLQRLFERADIIKKMDTSNFILQYQNDTVQMSEFSFIKLMESIKQDPTALIERFREKKNDEHMLIAYHDGKVVGTKMKL